MQHFQRARLIAELRDSIASIEAAPHTDAPPAHRESAVTRAQESATTAASAHPAVAITDQEDASCTDEAQEAYRKILRSASVREQSTARMRTKLLQASYSDQAVEAAIAKACRLGVIDDRRYADARLRAALAKGEGLRKTADEAASLGITLESLDAYDENLDAIENEAERAYRFIAAHPTRAKNKRDAAYRKLIQRGFGSDAAASAARRWAEEQL